MRHLTDLTQVHLDKPSVVTIGVFDGVHRGHQHLIRALVQEAHNSDRLAVAITFYPHPDVVLRGLTGRYYLTRPEQRAALLTDLGVDYVITLRFDDAFRHIRAAQFVEQMIEHLKLNALWVGSDFAMGYKREGDIAFLERMGAEKNFSIHVIDLLMTDHAAISSTAIREMLMAGDVEAARHLLGRAYSVSGEVVHGEKRGRQIGFPTANIDVWDEQVIPVNGIYAGWASLGSERFMAATNVGVRPTFDGQNVTVEAYLLDFDRDIYGQQLTFSFDKFLRPEARYDSLQALIDQIARDVEAARAFLAQHA